MALHQYESNHICGNFIEKKKMKWNDNEENISKEKWEKKKKVRMKSERKEPWEKKTHRSWKIRKIREGKNKDEKKRIKTMSDSGRGRLLESKKKEIKQNREKRIEKEMSWEK